MISLVDDWVAVEVKTDSGRSGFFVTWSSWPQRVRQTPHFVVQPAMKWTCTRRARMRSPSHPPTLRTVPLSSTRYRASDTEFHTKKAAL